MVNRWPTQESSFSSKYLAAFSALVTSYLLGSRRSSMVGSPVTLEGRLVGFVDGMGALAMVLPERRFLPLPRTILVVLVRRK